MGTTIVCGVDRSAASERAAGFAAMLAERLKSGWATAYIAPPPRLFRRSRRPRSMGGERSYFATGDPADELVRLADGVDAELVVIGCRGRRELGRALLGSVSSTLMLSCPCPLVVVPPGAAVPGHAAELSSAVCGVDASDRDEDVLRLGSDLVTRLGGTLHAVHAFDARPLVVPTGPPPVAERELREGAERRLERALRAAEVRARGHVVAAPPATALEDVAGREGAALIVVGSQAYGKLGSVVLGSVAIQVTAMAERPVVVLPPAARVGPGSGHYEVAGRSQGNA